MEDEQARELPRTCQRPAGGSASSVPDAPLISVILPVHNGGRWIDECLKAILAQTFLNEHPAGSLELSALDDGSTDNTWVLLQEWEPRLQSCGVCVCLGQSTAAAGGCGFAKNRAVAQSRGEFLCFQDVDDISDPTRASVQLAAARQHAGALIGAKVCRDPPDSTPRYTAWANGMSEEELVLHRFRECTLLMPTWFIARAAFNTNGAFREEKCEVHTLPMI